MKYYTDFESFLETDISSYGNLRKIGKKTSGGTKWESGRMGLIGIRKNIIFLVFMWSILVP